MIIKHLSGNRIRSKGNHLGSLSTASSYGTGIADNIRLTNASIKNEKPYSVLRDIKIKKSRPQKYVSMIN